MSVNSSLPKPRLDPRRLYLDDRVKSVTRAMSSRVHLQDERAAIQIDNHKFRNKALSEGTLRLFLCECRCRELSRPSLVSIRTRPTSIRQLVNATLYLLPCPRAKLPLPMVGTTVQFTINQSCIC